MTVISIEAAKSQLDRLIADVAAGDEVLFTEHDRPVAKLVPIATSSGIPKRRPGSAAGEILYMAEDFDAPLDDFKEYME